MVGELRRRLDLALVFELGLMAADELGDLPFSLSVGPVRGDGGADGGLVLDDAVGE